MLRIRHCVECPKCFTRYIVSFSPYRNGSYLITTDSSAEEYALHCSCSRASAMSRWREVKACAVSKKAYDRGYGRPDEITPVPGEQPGTWSVSPEYLDDWTSREKRRNSL